MIAQYVHHPSIGDQEGDGRAQSERSPTNINLDADVVTIGEALEVAALSAGDKPVDESDAAAIQAAEVRATGLGYVVPGGVGAEAQRAAAINTRTTRDEHKTKLSDVLTVSVILYSTFFRACLLILSFLFSLYRRYLIF